MVLAQERPHLFLLSLQPGTRAVFTLSSRLPPCLPVYMGADASESVCACFSLSLEASRHTSFVSLWAMVPSLGIQGPGSDAV